MPKDKLKKNTEEIQSPFPPIVSFVTGRINTLGNSTQNLTADELEQLDKFGSAKRKAEFIAGRVCAKQLLHTAGVPSTSLLKGRSGEVLWPSGFVGSISHSNDVVVSALSTTDVCIGLGVDIESKAKQRKLAIFDRLLHDSEKNWVQKAVSPEAKFYRALKLFSAKEALYKAYFTATQEKLTWLDVCFKSEEQKLVGTLNNTSAIAFLGKAEFIVGVEENQGYIITGVSLQESVE